MHRMSGSVTSSVRRSALTTVRCPGVKQLEKLIRKRLEEKRKDKAMRKGLQKAEELARGQ